MFIGSLRLAGLYGGFVLVSGFCTADIVSVVIQEVDSEAREITAVNSETNQTSTFRFEDTVRIRIGSRTASLSDVRTPVRARIVTGTGNRVRSILIAADEAVSEPRVNLTGSAEASAGGSASSARNAVGDWNQFRGPRRDNVCDETGLRGTWPEGGPELLMSVRGLGEGYSSVSVTGDVLCTMGNVDGGEFLIALDRASGQIVWKTRSGDEYREGQGNGPRGTPTIAGSRVYALGANGDLTCCDLNDGTVHWRRNILKDFGGENIVWGISESVLVDDDRVICSPGGINATVVALNADTGATEWSSLVPGNPRASYASPMKVTVGDVAQYVVFTSDGIAGIRASDGQPMWGQNASSNGTANCATPLIIGTQVFSSSDYGTGAELVELRPAGKSTTSRLVYHTRDMKNHHGGMIHLNGYVYGSNDDIFSCVELATGKPVWRQRGMKGSPVYADGKIVFRNEGGEVVLLAANPERFEVLGRFPQPDRSGRPAWAHPVIAGGRLYLRDQDLLLVYDLK